MTCEGLAVTATHNKELSHAGSHFERIRRLDRQVRDIMVSDSGGEGRAAVEMVLVSHSSVALMIPKETKAHRARFQPSSRAFIKQSRKAPRTDTPRYRRLP